MADEIRWQARTVYTGTLLTGPIICILPVIIDGESAVQDACEDYFRGSEFGHLEELIVTITEPAEVAGDYLVSLRRVVKASVQKQ